MRDAVPLGPSRSAWAGTEPEWHGHGMEVHAPSIGVDRPSLEEELLALARLANVEVFQDRASGIGGGPGEWVLSTNDTRHPEHKSRFVIDATGRRAAIARRLGAKVEFGPPLVARLKTLANVQLTGLVIEATENGWWYALPHPSGGSTVAFLGTPGAEPDAPRLLPVREDGFGDALALDARSARLSHFVGERWLAAGDAASAYDPVSSQGLFDALSSGFFAGNAAVDALAGRSEALQAYGSLVMRTAQRTHAATPRHYASAGRRSPFWTLRSGGHEREKVVTPLRETA